MNKYAEEYKQYYPKAFAAVFLFLGISVYLITRNDKPREDFIHQRGTIAYLSAIYPLNTESEPRLKDMYLILNEYNRIFEMFTGTDKGDFSPRMNRLRELKVGDTVDIYFEENRQTSKDQVNRLIQYLNKDGALYYLRSKSDRYIGYFMLGISGLLLIAGIYMKVKSE